MRIAVFYALAAALAVNAIKLDQNEDFELAETNYEDQNPEWYLGQIDLDSEADKKPAAPAKKGATK